MDGIVGSERMVEEKEEVLPPFSMDLGNLVVTSPLASDCDVVGLVTQLIHGLFVLPKGSDMPEVGRLVRLPGGTTALPRSKPVPSARAETTWEKFAREKGIVKKRKRERMIWDETSRTFKPRYGYKRAGNETEEGVSGREELRRKGERVAVNEKKMVGNEKRAGTWVDKGKTGKFIENARRSTGSVGRFGEGGGGKGVVAGAVGKRARRLGGEKEREQVIGLADKVLREVAKGGGLEAERRKTVVAKKKVRAPKRGGSVRRK